MIIPDSLVITILVLPLLQEILNYIVYKTPMNILNSIGGLLFAGGLFLLIVILSNGVMDRRDVTLIGLLGFVLGITYIVLTIFLSFILGGLISVLLLATGIKIRKNPIPFGPFIVLAYMITLFWGQVMMDWYMNIIVG